MKKVGAFLVMLSLLSLVPLAFAADSASPASSPDHRRARRAASPPPSPADQDWHGGDLRQPGAYLGQDRVLHHIPALQDARVKVN